MSKTLVRLFTPEQLQALDQKQLAILKNLIENEVDTNDQIRQILKAKFDPMYNTLKGGSLK
jgi:hypothetical protein